jgi:hypothetical protein
MGSLRTGLPETRNAGGSCRKSAPPPLGSKPEADPVWQRAVTKASHHQRPGGRESGRPRCRLIAARPGRTSCAGPRPSRPGANQGEQVHNRRPAKPQRRETSRHPAPQCRGAESDTNNMGRNSGKALPACRRRVVPANAVFWAPGNEPTGRLPVPLPRWRFRPW